MRTFNVVVERDPDTGLYVGHVPGWPGAHSQGVTLDELRRNLREGSHRQYRHSDGRGTTIPFHPGRDISPTLLRKIARDVGLTVEELLDRE
jgi:predicted RNA binding protein YcfA (HicA-like mRNA interferase family)